MRQASAQSPTRPSPDDTPAEIDFSRGTRAAARGVDVDQLVNELLKKDIELIEAAS